MLKQHGLPVKQDALLDHGRLMHHLVHGTMAAPSGAMMDEDYASMLATVGGHDDGNMVAQMQRVVCSEASPSSDSLYSLPPAYDSRQGHLDTRDLLQRPFARASSVQARGEADMDTPDQEVSNSAPTAPDWDAGAAQTNCGSSAAPVHLAQTIQCVSYPPVQGASPTMTLLALTGCVSIEAEEIIRINNLPSKQREKAWKSLKRKTDVPSTRLWKVAVLWASPSNSES